jgi:hypothetical protein
LPARRTHPHIRRSLRNRRGRVFLCRIIYYFFIVSGGQNLLAEIFRIKRGVIVFFHFGRRLETLRVDAGNQHQTCQQRQYKLHFPSLANVFQIFLPKIYNHYCINGSEIQTYLKTV